MNTDVHFVKGHSHDICEDYGLCCSTGDIPYIMVADGCSTGYHSDISSRIITHACKTNMSLYLDYYDLDDSILQTLIESSRILGLGDMLSTLILAFRANDKVWIYFYGDGFLVYKYRNEEKQIVEIDYEDNVPNYIWYMKDPNLYKIDDSKLRINGEIKNFDPLYSLNISNLEYVAIMTDGINSFIKNKDIENSPFSDKISSSDAINNLLDFKSTTGKFVIRRMNRFLKTTQQFGFIHDDDISCAVMHFGE